MTDSVHRTGCLDPEEIMVFLRDRASRPWPRALDDHLAGCAACRQLLAALVRVESAASGRLGGDLSATSLRAGSDVGGSVELSVPSVTDVTALSLTAGQQVGRYEIVSRLGEGGMGVVYCARDPELGRKVALKLLRGAPDRAAHDRRHERLRREAHAMAQVTHPNVVTVYDVGTWNDRIFIAMEMVEGQTLADWLALRPRGWREVVAMFTAAGHGLAAAHAAGLVHRDFKPSNVLLGDDGRVRVGDFGLATEQSAPRREAPPESASAGSAELARDIGSRSLAATIAGTPFFMAPEQLRGEPADARSDQFSFCVALYAAITGEHPFAGFGDDGAAATRGGSARRATPRMPGWLWKLIRRGIAHDPRDRHPSMAAVLAVLAHRGSRWPKLAVVALAGCAVIASVLVGRATALDDPPASDPPVLVGAPPAEAIAVLAGAPDLREAYEREWRVLNTEICELPHARCSIQATNLLRNADFARPGEAWRGEGTIDLQWRDGALHAAAGARGGTLVQDLPWVIPPRRAYRFTASVRAASGQPSAAGTLMLSSTGAGGEPAATPFVVGRDWTEVSVAVTGNAPATRFRAALALDPASQIEIDSAALIDAGLGDPGFELERAAGWRPVNFLEHVEVTPVTTGAVDGRRALRIRTMRGGGSIAQDSSRTPLAGTTYTFTAWLRAGSAVEVYGELGLWAMGSNDRVTVTGFRVGPAWTKFTATVDALEFGHTSFRAELYVYAVDAPLDIDAASLTPAGLVDASFETNAPAWYAPDAGLTRRQHTIERAVDLTNGAFDLGRLVDAARDGQSWLRVTSARPGASLAQDLGQPLRGTTYSFSAWLRQAPGSAAPVTGALVVQGIGATVEQGRTAFTAARDWTEVTATLTVDADDHTGLRVAIALDQPDAQLDIDATRLTGAIVMPFAIGAAN